MKTKEIQAITLTNYLFAIESIQDIESIEEIKDFLWSMELQHGICNFVLRHIRIDISEEYWVEKYKIDVYYWGITPLDTKSKEQAIDALRIRVNNLQKELNEE